MKNMLRNLIPLLLLAGIILLSGCSGSPVNPSPTPVPTPVQAGNLTAVQPPSPSLSGQNPSLPVVTENVTPAVSRPQSPLPNRVDVIYFHVNQRCPTCMCFEQRVNYVIATHFTEAISSGKLTYRVLNAQQEQNAATARKYGAVGSQLFVNTVTNGQDSIKDIQEIWNWNCRYSTPDFDSKVKSTIEKSLEGLP